MMQKYLSCVLVFDARQRGSLSCAKIPDARQKPTQPAHILAAQTNPSTSDRPTISVRPKITPAFVDR
jgi:hypothetical protein